MQHLISDKLINLIEHNKDTILRSWVDHLKSDPTTSSFLKTDLDKFEIKAKMTLKEIGHWASYDTPKEDVGRKYAQEGKGLFKMGIPLCEGVRALILLKRSLWLFVAYESDFESALELNQMRELIDRILLFFDRAQFYFIRGYLEEMHNKMKECWNLTDENTLNVFFDKSFYGKPVLE